MTLIDSISEWVEGAKWSLNPIAYMPYLLKPFMCLVDPFCHSLQHGYWVPSLYEKSLNQALPLAVLSWSSNPENCWTFWLGPFTYHTTCPKYKNSLFLLCLICALFLSTSITYYRGIQIFVDHCISCYLHPWLILGSFWPHFLVTPTHICESYLYYKNILPKVFI